MFYVNILYDCHDTINIINDDEYDEEEKKDLINQLWKNETKNILWNKFCTAIGGAVGSAFTGGSPMGALIGSFLGGQGIELAKKFLSGAEKMIESLVNYFKNY